MLEKKAIELIEEKNKKNETTQNNTRKDYTNAPKRSTTTENKHQERNNAHPKGQQRP